MTMIRLLMMVACVFVLPLAVSGCATGGGVTNLKWTRLAGAPADLGPNTGDIVVIWKEHGFPIAYKKREYILVGRVSGRSKWCGIVAPRDNEELHASMIEEAKKHGGNGIIMSCGIGSVVMTEATCYCFADVIRFK